VAELEISDAGSWFQSTYAEVHIPSLSEVLERYRGSLYFHVEIEGAAENLSQGTINMVRKYGVAHSVTITSFQKGQLQEIRTYAPELPAGWLLREIKYSTLAQANDMGLAPSAPWRTRSRRTLPSNCTRWASRFGPLA